MTNLLFSFKGRVNRAKWWLVSIAVGVVETILFGIILALFSVGIDAKTGMPQFSGIGAILAVVVLVVSLWISLALAVKRWHDRDKSGWWIFITLVPVVGGIWYLIECGFLKGTSGANTYGEDPLPAG
jgi:uncharacterized membrane protein YhaH (DUF805 family)